MSVLHGWEYCPRCRARLSRDGATLACPECGLAVYANPGVSACALVLDADGRVLLARRAENPERGKWDLPGGFVEEGEHPLDAVRRELQEETGLEIEPGELLGAWPDWYGQGPAAAFTINLYWTARATRGEPVAADDVSELSWFAPGELPGLDELAFTNVAEVLSLWRARHEQA